MYKIIYLLISLVVLSTTLLAQSEKKIKKDAKEFQRHLDNLELKIVTRNLDFTKVLAVSVDNESGGWTMLLDSKLEKEYWTTALFAYGLDVVVIEDIAEAVVGKTRADYLIEIYRGGAKISDINNNNKIVATLTYRLKTIKYREKLINHIIKELVGKSK